MVTVPGYRIEELLSWGTQGDVFRAVDPAGRPVALKLVTADRNDGDPQALARLRREARLLAAVDSPHVVKVHEFLQEPTWCCLVLELLAGQRLDTELRARAGLPPEMSSTSEPTKVLAPAPRRFGKSVPRVVAPPALQTAEHVLWALDVALQLARGLAAMHGSHLIHRDVKPQNAMLVDGRVVLIDFGFARSDGVTTMTQTGTAIGTLAFMSPEQLAGGESNTCTDVHALGATMHQCLAGSPPFGSTAPSIRVMATRGRPRDVRKANPAVGASFAAVVARCLEPDPRDRYPDAGAVLADLQRVQRGEAVRAPFSAGRLWRHHRRLLSRLAAVAAGLVLLAWLLTGFDADAVAASIQREVAADHPAAAADAWRACRTEERVSVTEALNHRLADDGELAKKIAGALGLALLCVAPRANHLIALMESREGEAAPSLTSAVFLPTDRESNLLVRPGLAWCLLMSREPQDWWAPDDPLCLQMLLRVTAGPTPTRSLALLPTRVFGRIGLDLVPFAAGSHDVCDEDGNASKQELVTPFGAGPMEVSAAMLVDFRRTIAALEGSREEIDFWMRHPDESDDVAKELWQTWRAVKGNSDDGQPALISFWEAHRFAVWRGCRLPSLLEWRIAAWGGKDGFGTREQREVPKTLAAVDAVPAWDLTERGISHANSNAREWALERRDQGPKTGFFVLPTLDRMNPGPYYYSSRLPLVGAPPGDKNGLRLYRTLQAAAAR